MQEDIIANAGELVTVTEGSNVTLKCNVDRSDYTITWKQTSGIDVELKDEDTTSPSFKAPYIDTPNTLLTFKLTVKGSNIIEDTVRCYSQKGTTGSYLARGRCTWSIRGWGIGSVV